MSWRFRSPTPSQSVTCGGALVGRRRHHPGLIFRSTAAPRPPRLHWAALFALLVSGRTQVHQVEIPDTVPELRPGILQGYLDPEALPDSAALVPQPPAEGSTALARDQEASASALSLRGTPRWNLAAADAALTFPESAGSFSYALGAPITEQAAPNLYMLLRRSLADRPVDLCRQESI